MNTTLLHPNSLSATLDAVNDAFLANISITIPEKLEIGRWISSRQGLLGSYAGMPAPTNLDVTSPIKRYTGEPLNSGASLSHVLGQEACRVLLKLKLDDIKVNVALRHATEGMLAAITRENDKHPDRAGTYCCGGCTPAYWRHLAAGGLKNAGREIEAGMMVLKSHRSGDGRWTRFPSAWTISALVEIGDPALEELKYAAKVLESFEKVKAPKGIYQLRRQAIARRGLELI